MIQEYKFRVEREAEESKRKQIEADGIAAFQKTVSQGISESYLRWRGIEATLLLSQSPNAKVVVIGSGKDGLPIILNAEPVGPGGAAQSGSGGSSPNSSSQSSSPGGASPSNGSGNPAPPAPASNAPPNTSTAPNASPGSPPNKPAPGTSGSAAPAVPQDVAGAPPASLSPQSGTIAPTATALDLPGVRPILSGLSGALRAGADLISPESKAKQ
jgi:hypothetical protein